MQGGALQLLHAVTVKQVTEARTTLIGAECSRQKAQLPNSSQQEFQCERILSPKGLGVVTKETQEHNSSNKC